MKQKAFIHIVDGGVPAFGGSSKDLIRLIASMLCRILSNDPSQWGYACDEIHEAFIASETTGRTILRWVNYIAKGLIVGLAMFGSVMLGLTLTR